ncbi:hypothetical protein TNCV_4376171 [Trichonephila clavipes]|nr:hypothetical protein TNCV_4376171 [Trichonephila clavipes]
MPSTDQSSRRPLHHTTLTRRANCLLRFCPVTSHILPTGPVSYRTNARFLDESHMVSWHALHVLPMTLPTEAPVWSGDTHDGIGWQ